MARAYRAVVFDLDGTIINSAPAMQKIAGTFLARHDRAPLTLEETRAFIGEGARTFCRRMLAARDIAADEAALDAAYERFLSLYVAAPAADNAVYHGAQEALAAIAGSGRALGLCTNKPEGPTQKVLGAFDLASILQAIVTGDTLAEKKPHPAPLLHAIAQLGARPEDTLFVGDSETDAKTAAAASVDFALHMNGYAHDAAALDCGFRFRDWSELAAFLAEPHGRS